MDVRLARFVHLEPVARHVVNPALALEPAVGNQYGVCIRADRQVVFPKVKITVRNNQIAAGPLDRALKVSGAEHQRKLVVGFARPFLHQRGLSAAQGAPHKHGAFHPVHRVFHINGGALSVQNRVIKLGSVVFDILDPDGIVTLGDVEVDVVAFIIQPLIGSVAWMPVGELKPFAVSPNGDVSQRRSVGAVIGDSRCILKKVFFQRCAVDGF